jgi:hypothetical protein
MPNYNREAKMAKLSQGDITVSIDPLEPSQATVSTISRAVLANRILAGMLKGTQHRVLSVDFIDASQGRQQMTASAPPERFRATIYDYTNHRTLLADGRVKQPSKVSIEETAIQPFPTEEEFRTAVNHLTGGEKFGARLRSEEIVAVRPMPPMISEEMPDGRTRRFVAAGLLTRGGRSTAEILGVDPLDGTLRRFPEHAPLGSRPGNTETCGAPVDVGQRTADKGTPGRVKVTIRKGAKTIWKFTAIRPAASSGTNGSGIELRSVYLRGKRMLGRAHVPILNVKYDQDRCGPYRDWQFQEGQIEANGTDVGNTGFRLCPTPARTIMDTGSDSGNFLGVGVYIKEPEIVFVSEMEAGWYRYVSEWRFDVDGTLRPRFGFAAVQNSCVCNRHHHHVYWRLDFDVITSGGNRVSEYNDPALVGSNKWDDKKFEVARARDPLRKRHWRVVNLANKAAVDILPGANDGLASTMPDAPFGRGDVWILRFRDSEFDDGVVAVGPPYEANIGQWVNGEAIDNHDVVIWYAGHFTHNLREQDAAQHGHLLGPDIKPINWPN